MANEQPDISEMSYAGGAAELDLQPKVAPSSQSVDAGETTSDYSALLTEPIGTKTQFGRAAIRLEEPAPAEPAPALSDEQGLGYAWNELPLVLSHYDLGTIKRIE